MLVDCWRWRIPANTVTWSDEIRHLFDPTGGSLVTYEAFLECIHIEDRSRMDR